MWIIDDETFHDIIGGNYDMVINLKQKEQSLTMRELFCVQFVYASYDGFRKFYKKKISKAVKGAKQISNSSIVGKLLKVLFK